MISNVLGWIFNLIYRVGAPWDMAKPRHELVEMVEQGFLQPCRSIDLGCGTGDNVIFLAQHGFDSFGVDLSSRAIKQARARARLAGVSATFILRDVTALDEVDGSFDLVLDYGCMGCIIGSSARERYVETLLSLTSPGSKFLLLNFMQSTDSRLNFLPNALREGDVDRLLGDHFHVLKYEEDHEDGPLGLSVEFRVMQKA